MCKQLVLGFASRSKHDFHNFAEATPKTAKRAFNNTECPISLFRDLSYVAVLVMYIENIGPGKLALVAS